MSIYEFVKANVTVPQAAEHYGVEVQRNGMCRCPFHDDRHPSMKLNKDYFYCFGCGAHGDVIEFTARLFGLGSYEAAKKLAHDFGLDPDKPPAGEYRKNHRIAMRAFRSRQAVSRRGFRNIHPRAIPSKSLKGSSSSLFAAHRSPGNPHTR